MKWFGSALKNRKAIAIAIAIGVLIGTVLFSLAFYENNRLKQQEVLEATEHFVILDNKLNSLVYTNINLLQGFVAYLQTNDHITDESIYKFLGNLMISQESMIDNIGILEDTTIVWNYPYEKNKNTIGVDLALVESQKEAVLKVKNDGTILFQGPIDLVQGGKGFTIRRPIVDLDGDYWGQASIILKYDEFVKSIHQFESELEIQMVIYSNGELIYGEGEYLDEKLHWFTFDDAVFDWDVGFKLIDQGNEGIYRMLLFGFLGVGVLFIVSISAYINVRANEKVRHESIHDHLTGLRNRYTLEETIEQIFAASNRNGNKAGILLIDLNRFKEINDTYGHITGDIVLKEVAERLQKASRADELLFRVGGDEFLLVAPIVNGYDVLKTVKDRFKGYLNFVLDVKGNEIQVSASIGCALYKDDGENYDVLYHVADQRMYDEKLEKSD